MKTMRLGIGACAAAIALAATGVASADGDVEVKANQDDGFVITDGEAFSLRAELLLQVLATRSRQKTEFSGALYEWINDRGEFPDVFDTIEPGRTGFDISRARVAFRGTAIAEWLGYRIEVEHAGPLDTTELLDAYVLLGNPEKWSFTIGQFKAPFDQFRLADAGRRLFADRGLVAETLAPGRDTGAMVRWRSNNKRWQGRLAVQNGSGRNRPNDDDDVMTTIRFEYQSEGGFDENQSAIDHDGDFRYTFGLAYLENSHGAIVDADMPSSPCVIGASKFCDFDTLDERATEAFFAGRGSNFQINASYQMWTFEDGRVVAPDGARDDKDVDAVQVSAGFFTSDRFEVVGRFGKISSADRELIAPPFGPSALIDPELVAEPRPNLLDAKMRTRSFGFGINYYFKKQNFRLHAGWTKSETETSVFDRFRAYVPDLGRGVPTIVPRTNVRREGEITQDDSVWAAMLQFSI